MLKKWAYSEPLLPLKLIKQNCQLLAFGVATNISSISNFALFLLSYCLVFGYEGEEILVIFSPTHVWVGDKRCRFLASHLICFYPKLCDVIITYSSLSMYLASHYILFTLEYALYFEKRYESSTYHTCLMLELTTRVRLALILFLEPS